MELSIRTDLTRKRELTAILKKFFKSWKDQTVEDVYVATVDADPQRLRRLLFVLERSNMKNN